MHYTKKYKSVLSLTFGNNKKSGRNDHGKITTRHQGGGHKQAIRKIDWKRDNWHFPESRIIGIEYDPIRNSPLVKLCNTTPHRILINNDTRFNTKPNIYSYILAPEGAKLFQKIYNYTEKDSTKVWNYSNTNLFKIGDSAPISFFEVGDFIHAIEAFPNQGSIFSRSAGTFCQIISINQLKPEYIKNKLITNYAIIRLPSGAQRYISINAKATLGIVSLLNKNNINMQKAGRIRWLGHRPSVRGVAINPVDHPHGGGQGKTSGGRPSVTFKSWPTKGKPTRNSKRKNKFILKSNLCHVLLENLFLFIHYFVKNKLQWLLIYKTVQQRLLKK